jgi:acyl-[acyl-carrier-protein] desaturase
MLHWGAEESRHGPALEQILLQAGARDENQLEVHRARIAETRWTPAPHQGMDGLLGALVYMAIQERATYTNYVELRRRVRAEYGLPAHQTPLEQRRSCEQGASEVLRRISLDEIAHHGLFLKLVQLHLRHFPELTTEKIQEVAAHFSMPALRLIPNRRSFVRAVIRTGLYGEAKHRELVHDRLYRLLGLASADSVPRFCSNGDPAGG